MPDTCAPVDLFLGIYRRELEYAVGRAEHACELTGLPIALGDAVYVEGAFGRRVVAGAVWDGWRTFVEAHTGRPDRVADGRELFPAL